MTRPALCSLEAQESRWCNYQTVTRSESEGQRTGSGGGGLLSVCVLIGEPGAPVSEGRRRRTSWLQPSVCPPFPGLSVVLGISACGSTPTHTGEDHPLRSVL